MRFILTLLAAAAIASTAIAQQSPLARVQFDAGEATLDAQALAGLDHAIAPLHQINGTWALTVIGHTDPSEGTGAAATALSQRRASAVRDALVARGVPASLITDDGGGGVPTRPGRRPP